MGHANSYDCYSEFILRCPVFPLNKLEEIPSHPDHLPGYLIQQWEDPLIKDAIQLASPSLFIKINSEIKEGRLSPGVGSSYLRYLMRMCYRSTPFGLFAGLAVGDIGGQNEINLKENRDFLLKCRLDMEYLAALVQNWSMDEKIRSSLSYSSNSSLYKIGRKWRYIEVLFSKDGRKNYNIVAVDQNPVLDDLISNTYILRTWKYLCKIIIDKGYLENDALAYLNDLVSSQILVPEWHPNLTGQEYSHRLSKITVRLETDHSRLQLFRIMTEKISLIQKPGDIKENLDEVIAMAGAAEVNFNPGHLIQGDLLIKYNKAELSLDLSNKVLLGIRMLKSLSIKRPNKTIEKFKEYFNERFGTREVPLPMVMDAEYGIGLEGPMGQQLVDPSPLLDGLDYPVDVDIMSDIAPHPLLLKKLKVWKKSDGYYIDLSKDDIRELGIQKGRWPNQLFAMCRLAGENVFFDLAAEGNPANLLARFGFLEPHGKLNKHLVELTRDDKNNHPDDLLAEIVHLPEDRTGNILQRPSLFDWEIPFLAARGNEARPIHPGDILVSVRNDKVVLRSKNNGRRILPRLTNAHNYQSRQLDLYRFLAECINQENTRAYLPNWGRLSEFNDFLPGIRYGSLILSQARWRLQVDNKIRESDSKGDKLYELILQWAKKNKLPQKLVWLNGEHEILIDLGNRNVVLSAWKSISKMNNVIFKDDPYKTGSLVKSKMGEHANELVLTFKKALS